MSSRPEKLVKIGAIVFIVLSLAVAIAYLLDRDRPLGEGYKQAKDYGGDFTMQGSTGSVSLSDYRGKVVMIYFGFMNCQEACPVSLLKMRIAMSRLNDDEKSRVQGIFVSVDPERDNPQDLNAFLKNYDQSFVGLTDTQEKTDQVLKQYGVFSDLEDFDNKSVTYSVDHSSRFYLLDKDGKLQTTMSHTTTAAELVAKLRSLF